MKEEILKLAGRHLEEATALRHELHKIPEIAGKEFKTSALLRKRLEALPGVGLCRACQEEREREGF